jgi:hypothetical protein
VVAPGRRCRPTPCQLAPESMRGGCALSGHPPGDRTSPDSPIAWTHFC